MVAVIPMQATFLRGEPPRAGAYGDGDGDGYGDGDGDGEDIVPEAVAS